jgi:large conductance mechanosensitive channel
VLKGFKDFVMRGNVVDLAIAVVIGTAFTQLVEAFVKDILTPLIAAIAGKPNFANLQFTVNHSVFLYGDVINAIVTFLLVALALYVFVVHPLNVIAARRAAGQPVPAAEVPADVALLSEIRDILAAQQPAEATATDGAGTGGTGTASGPAA